MDSSPSPAGAHPLGPLSPLAAWPQFIVAMLAPKAGGKAEKIPVDPRTGYPIDPHKPQFWTDYATAAAAASAWGPMYRVGFVLTEADPFVVVDLDGVRQDDSTWSPLALEIAGKLPGAVLEVSQSGKGLHIWCKHPNPPEHASKRVDLGIEAYSSKRFIMLGTQHTGQLADLCTALPAVLAEYFPPRVVNAAEIPDTGPCPEWRGPNDDDELLRRAMQSRSMASVYGAKASFADLWNANAEVLAKAYPADRSSSDAFDHSSADAALAAQLAFWTGKNVARIERLMRQSKLARAKWDDRSDYLVERTIKGQCARQVQVLQDKHTLTLTEALAALRDMTMTEAAAGWLSLAQQLNRADREAFVEHVNRQTGLGRQAIKATIREAQQAETAEAHHAEWHAKAQGRTPIEHFPDSSAKQAAEVEALIVASAKPGEYVQFGGVLSQIAIKELPFTHMAGDADQAAPSVPLIEPLGKAQVVAQAERVAQFYEMRRDGTPKAIAVPERVLQGLLDSRVHSCPVVNGLVTHPLTLRNGEILQGEGLHTGSGLYLQGATGQGLRPFTQAEAVQALAWLRVVFLEGFEFASDLDRDAALAGLITGVQRRVLDSAPGVAILASTQSSGKTTLARRLHLVLTGRDMPASTFALGNEPEVAKALLSTLLRSPVMVCFDNVPDGYTFKSGALAAAMTSPLMEQRVLGGSIDATVPTNTLFALTGNNLSLGNDEVTRWLVVRLAPSVSRPECRIFRHADVVAYAHAIRADVLRLVVGVVAGYLASGTTMQAATRFPTWDRMVRQSLRWAGGADVADVFRANDEQSEPKRAHRAVVARLWAHFGTEEFSAYDAAMQARVDKELSEGLHALPAKDAFNSRSVGHALTGKAGSVVNLDGQSFKIVQSLDRNKVGRYAVVTV